MRRPTRHLPVLWNAQEGPHEQRGGRWRCSVDYSVLRRLLASPANTSVNPQGWQVVRVVYLLVCKTSGDFGWADRGSRGTEARLLLRTACEKGRHKALTTYQRWNLFYLPAFAFPSGWHSERLLLRLASWLCNQSTPCPTAGLSAAIAPSMATITTTCMASPLAVNTKLPCSW